MPDDLVQSAAIGVIGSLLAFELVAAVRSWLEARGHRTRAGGATRPRADADQPIFLSQAFAIRDHLARRRRWMNRLRGQYAELGTSRHARQLRMSIGRVQPSRFGDVTATCPYCRMSRLKGRAHCLECRHRLVVPAVPAGA
jgi:hypothetical protein